VPTSWLEQQGQRSRKPPAPKKVLGRALSLALSLALSFAIDPARVAKEEDQDTPTSVGPVPALPSAGVEFDRAFVRHPSGRVRGTFS